MLLESWPHLLSSRLSWHCTRKLPRWMSSWAPIGMPRQASVAGLSLSIDYAFAATCLTLRTVLMLSFLTGIGLVEWYAEDVLIGNYDGLKASREFIARLCFFQALGEKHAKDVHSPAPLHIVVNAMQESPVLSPEAAGCTPEAFCLTVHKKRRWALAHPCSVSWLVDLKSLHWHEIEQWRSLAASVDYVFLKCASTAWRNLQQNSKQKSLCIYGYCIHPAMHCPHHGIRPEPF